MSKSKVLQTIRIYIQKNKARKPTYLNTYEETLMVASADIKGAHGMHIEVNTLGAELKRAIKSSQLMTINQYYHSQLIIQVPT